MSKITDYQTLLDKLLDLEFNTIMEDRNLIIDIVWEEVKGRLESMGYDELTDLAECHGIEAELEDE